MTSFQKARALALLVPAALLAGAWGFQLIGHLYPCEMCHWQRWPHYAALPIALLAFVPGLPQRPLVVLAAIAIAISGVIGVAHAGVEYHWWQGFTPCTSTFSSGGDTLSAIMNAPVVRCDAPQWTFAGVSLAGFNAVISLGGALIILFLLTRRSRAA
ncbi:disulfide bond formation protein B [Sphingomonas pruni]|uniref:disulfide bond formation protein B n=1 Tax=Sphingomonas pruni TaxID=40683 RepID=UPI000829610A|nr:disulfide bond formation protein B [Sphingomonas pruni]